MMNAGAFDWERGETSKGIGLPIATIGAMSTFMLVFSYSFSK
jgi:hypothetical protein